MDTQEPVEKKLVRKKSDRYDVKTKCAAVLAIWSERRQPKEVCRELGIPWGILTQWQNLAMEGMVQALSPRQKGEERPAALNPRLEQRLLKKLALRSMKANRLQARLKAIETEKDPSEPSKE